MRSARLTTISASFVIAASLAACGSGQATVPAPNPAGPSLVTTQPIPSPLPAPAESGQTTQPPAPSPSLPLPKQIGAGWSTAAQSPPADPKLGQGILYSVRYASHTEDGGFDRFVFDFKGPIPGANVSYVDHITQDGSGAIVNLPGSHAFLEVRFDQATAHYDDGTDALPANRRQGTPNLPMLHAYKLTGDYEGVVHMALGLNAKTPFRTGTVPGPNGGQTSSSFYIDFRH